MDVALFITCLTDQFYPRVGIAVTKILEHLGCTVHFPQAQTCCGQPFYNNGFNDEAAALAKRMIEIFEGYDYIVTPSASCCSTVRNHYPELLGHDPAWATGVRRLADNTFEFVEFLTRVLKVDLSRLTLPEPRTVTYHYTCHQRGINLTTQAQDLLRQLGNVTFRPMEKADQCCGFGGTFAVKHPAISAAIVKDKVDCFAATGAPLLIVNEAGCAMNIAGAAHRQNIPMQTLHLAELIAQAIGLDTAGW